jgi:ATP-binding cassette, subfamily C (CFTR/MRP), member 1
MADRVSVLGKDGTISEEGSFEELVNMGGYISSVFESGIREAKDNTGTNTSQSDIDAISVQNGIKEPKKQADRIDKRRQLGDNTVYRFYFSSLGPVFVAILFAVEVSNAFLSCFQVSEILSGSHLLPTK